MADTKTATAETLGSLLAEVLTTDEIKALATRLAKDLLDGWAADAWMKKGVASAVKKYLIPTRPGQQPVRLDELLADPSFRERLRALFPDPAAADLSSWFSATEFGKIRDRLEEAEPGIVGAVQSANDALWQYPAKLVILLSLVPYSINLLSSLSRVMLIGFNQAPPDLVADLVNSLLREVEIDRLAGVLNEGVELLRKIQTGGRLIGDPGTSQLTRELGKRIIDIRQQLDLEKLQRVRSSLRAEKARLQQILDDSPPDNPQALARELGFAVGGLNSGIARLNSRLSNLLDLPTEALEPVFREMVEALDRQALAGVLEQVVRLLLRTVDIQPHLLPELLEDILQQVDPLELQDFIGGFTELSASAGNPLARAVIPAAITGICAVLAKQDDEFEERAAAARRALRSLLMDEEDGR